MAKYQNVAKTRMATAVALISTAFGQAELAAMGQHYRMIRSDRASGAARAKRIARKYKNVRARGAK